MGLFHRYPPCCEKPEGYRSPTKFIWCKLPEAREAFYEALPNTPRYNEVGSRENFIMNYLFKAPNDNLYAFFVEMIYTAGYSMFYYYAKDVNEVIVRGLGYIVNMVTYVLNHADEPGLYDRIMDYPRNPVTRYMHSVGLLLEEKTKVAPDFTTFEILFNYIRLCWEQDEDYVPESWMDLKAVYYKGKKEAISRDEMVAVLKNAGSSMVKHIKLFEEASNMPSVYSQK